jgi:hypothetical protein
MLLKGNRSGARLRDRNGEQYHQSKHGSIAYVQP